jgi:endothelin-converting enzyme
VFSWLASSELSSFFSSTSTIQLFNMADEKVPLVASDASVPVQPSHVQRYSKRQAIGRVFAIAATASFILYGLPQGAFIHILNCITANRSLVDYEPTGDYQEESELCLTPACVHAASEILYNLSPQYKELDPCDDFEELVCGGWRDRHDLRADQGDAFTGTIMSENSQMLLRHILEAPYPKDSEVSAPLLITSTQTNHRVAFLLLTYAAHVRCQVR